MSQLKYVSRPPPPNNCLVADKSPLIWNWLIFYYQIQSLTNKFRDLFNMFVDSIIALKSVHRKANVLHDISRSKNVCYARKKQLVSALNGDT